MDDSIFVKYWMLEIITLWTFFLYGINFIQYWILLLWMFFVWNKFHPILDGSYHHTMDVFCIKME